MPGKRRHPHGTPACGRNGCRRHECHEAWLSYCRRRQKLHRLGRSLSSEFATREEALELVTSQMREHRLNGRQFVQASGVAPSTLWKIKQGHVMTVSPVTMRAFSELPYLDQVERFFIPQLGYRLRYQGLAACGWGHKDVSEYLGTDAQPRAKRRLVTRETNLKMIALCEKVLADGPDPRNRRVSKIAKKHGWLPLQSFEREKLLDPEWDGMGGILVHGPTTFDEIDLFKHVERPHKARKIVGDQEIIEEYRHFVDYCGYSAAEVAEILGITLSRLRKVIAEHGM